MMFIVLIFAVLFVANPARADEAGPTACSDKVPCPANYSCIVGVGCVSTRPDSTCKCPVTACAWPYKCDCQGGCRATPCTTTAQCGAQLVNPRNKCQVMKCDAETATCTGVAADCKNCHPQRGCPAPVIAAEGVKAVQEDPEEQPQGGDAIDDEMDGEYGARSVSVQHHTSTTTTPGSQNGWVIFLIVAVSLTALVVLGLAVYACYVMWPSKKKSATAY